MDAFRQRVQGLNRQHMADETIRKDVFRLFKQALIDLSVSKPVVIVVDQLEGMNVDDFTAQVRGEFLKWQATGLQHPIRLILVVNADQRSAWKLEAPNLLEMPWFTDRDWRILTNEYVRRVLSLEGKQPTDAMSASAIFGPIDGISGPGGSESTLGTEHLQPHRSVDRGSVRALDLGGTMAAPFDVLSEAGFLTGMLDDYPAPTQEMLRRAATLRSFDRELYDHVLTIDLPEGKAPPMSWEKLIRQSFVEPLPGREPRYRLKESVRLAFIATWDIRLEETTAGGRSDIPEDLRKLSSALADYYCDRPGAELDRLYHLVACDRESKRCASLSPSSMPPMPISTCLGVTL